MVTVRLLYELLTLAFREANDIIACLKRLSQPPERRLPRDAWRRACLLTRLPLLHTLLAGNCLAVSLFLYRAAVLCGRQPVFHLGVRQQANRLYSHAWTTLSGRAPGAGDGEGLWQEIFSYSPTLEK